VDLNDPPTAVGGIFAFCAKQMSDRRYLNDPPTPVGGIPLFAMPFFVKQFSVLDA
jgi:hypothetical protein